MVLLLLLFCIKWLVKRTGLYGLCCFVSVQWCGKEQNNDGDGIFHIEVEWFWLRPVRAKILTSSQRCRETLRAITPPKT